ncbi:stage 0 sporulation family protein [bacterium]
MPIVTSLRIRKTFDTIYGDSHSIYVIPGDTVILNTENGLEMGVVLEKEKTVYNYKGKIYRIVRKCNARDFTKLEENRKKEKEARKTCEQKIEFRDLTMDLTSVEYTFDRHKLFVYYTAEGRIDFRELIKDLGHELKTKIQMMQIGVRDEAKMLGGYGPCGRPVCCSLFLKEFKSVSIEAAKDQNLSLNPAKISGVCGRLMCCLSYEHPFYCQICKKMPKIGTKVQTPDGIGLIKNIAILKEEIEVIFDDGSAKKYKLEQIKK